MWVVKHVEKFWLKSSGHTFPFLSRFTVGCEDDLLSVLLLPTQPVWLETGQCLRLSWRPLRDPSAFSCLALKEPFSILPRKSKSSFTRLTEGKQEKEHREDGSLLNTAPDSRFPASPSLQPVNCSVKIKEWEFTGPERSQKVRTITNQQVWHTDEAGTWGLANFWPIKHLLCFPRSLTFSFPHNTKLGHKWGRRLTQKTTKQSTIPSVPVF